jgi:hypothetical protein
MYRKFILEYQELIFRSVMTLSTDLFFRYYFDIFLSAVFRQAFLKGIRMAWTSSVEMDSREKLRNLKHR